MPPMCYELSLFFDKISFVCQKTKAKLWSELSNDYMMKPEMIVKTIQLFGNGKIPFLFFKQFGGLNFLELNG
jgi:hypothetical protein